MLKKQQHRHIETGPYLPTADPYSNMNGTPLKLMILNQDPNQMKNAMRTLPLPSAVPYSPDLANGFNELDTLLHDLNSDQFNARTQRLSDDGTSMWPNELANRQNFQSTVQFADSRIRELASPGLSRVDSERKFSDGQPRIAAPKYELINEVHSNPTIVAAYNGSPNALLPSKPTLNVNASAAVAVASNGTSVRQTAARSVELDSLMASLNELDPQVSNQPSANRVTSQPQPQPQITSIGSSPNSSLSSSSSIRRSATSASPSSTANWAAMANGGRIGAPSDASANTPAPTSGGSGTPKRSGSPHVSFADDLVKVIPLSSTTPQSQPQVQSVPIATQAVAKPSTLKKPPPAPNGTIVGKPPSYVQNNTVPPGSSPIVVVQNMTSTDATPSWPASANGVIGTVNRAGSIVRNRAPPLEEQPIIYETQNANLYRTSQSDTQSAPISVPVQPALRANAFNAGHIAPPNDSRILGLPIGSIVQPVNANLSNAVPNVPSVTALQSLPPPPPPPPVAIIREDASHLDDETVYDTLEMYQFGKRNANGRIDVAPQISAPVVRNAEQPAVRKLEDDSAKVSVSMDDDIPLRLQPIVPGAMRGTTVPSSLQNAAPRITSAGSALTTASNPTQNQNQNPIPTASFTTSANVTSMQLGPITIAQMETKNNAVPARQSNPSERASGTQLHSPSSREANGAEAGRDASLSNFMSLRNANAYGYANGNGSANSNSNGFGPPTAGDQAGAGAIGPALLLEPPAQYQSMHRLTNSIASTPMQPAHSQQQLDFGLSGPTILLNPYSLATQKYSADSLSLTGSTASSRQFDTDRTRSASPSVSQSASGGVVCDACGEPLSGRAISAMGKFWHPEHFCCTVCHCIIGTQRFFERLGEPFCELCYLEEFAPHCAQCDRPIVDKCVTALGRCWHYEHFACAACNCLFDPAAGFLERDGRAYCVTDYHAMFGARCAACERPIGSEAFINAFGKQFHRSCWKCAECGRVFDASCSFCELDGRPVCDRHFASSKSSSSSNGAACCAKCNKAIASRCVTAQSRKYHPECFSCTFCLRPLVHDFRERDAKPYCSECYSKLVK